MELLSTNKIVIVEKYYGKKDPNRIGATIEYIKRNIYIDDEFEYSETTKALKRSYSPLEDFIRWLLFKERPHSSADGGKAGKDRPKSFGFFGRFFLKRFYFKLKFIVSRLKQFFLNGKTTSLLKVESIQQENKSNVDRTGIQIRNKSLSLELRKDSIQFLKGNIRNQFLKFYKRRLVVTLWSKIFTQSI